MKPYYEHSGITIYNGDCREIIAQLEEIPESIVTDPVWPNCEHIFPGIDAGELLGSAIRTARGIRRAVIQVGCNSDPRFFQCVPLDLKFLRTCYLGPQKAKYGSFYLWGDVEQVGDRILAGADIGKFGAAGLSPGDGFKGGDGSWFSVANNTNGHSQNPVHALASGTKVPGFRFDGSGRSFQTSSVEATLREQAGILADMERSLGNVELAGAIEERAAMTDIAGRPGVKYNPDGSTHPKGSWFRIADSSQGDRGIKTGHPERSVRNGHKSTAHLTNPAEHGTKIGGDWFSDPHSTCRKHGSRSSARKAASAMIAKIPLPLSQYIARAFKPEGS